MPAKSKSQQRLMGMVHAQQKGEFKTSNASLRSKVKKVAGSIKDKDAEKFARTKHKGLPNRVNESKKPTFIDFLLEMSKSEQEALTPPAAVQTLYAKIKKKYGMVKRDVFMNHAVDAFNLTPEGLKHLMSKPYMRAMVFADQEAPSVVARDPWAHVSQKGEMRRAQQAQQTLQRDKHPQQAPRRDIMWR